MKGGHGGKRKGAGAPTKDPSGKKRAEESFFITKDEKRFLKECLDQRRKSKGASDEFIG